MPDINTQEILQTISDFARKYKFHGLILVAALIFLTIGGMFYSDHRNKTEADVSNQVNRLVNQIKRIEFAEETTFEDEENLRTFKAQLEDIYDKNKGYNNGLRALFLAANMDLKNNEFDAARDKYLKVFDGNKRYFLAPSALFYAALVSEEKAEFDRAVELLTKYEKYYFDHFLYAEARITLARIYENQTKPEEARKVLEDLKITRNGEFKDLADEKLRLLDLKSTANIQTAPPAGLDTPVQPAPVLFDQ